MQTDERIGQLVGNHRLVRELGRGGVGTVYLAEHLYLPQRSAIKILHRHNLDQPRIAALILHEAQLEAALRHPHIVEVRDFGFAPDGCPYLVMELVEGEPLCNLLEDGPLPRPRAVAIVDQIATALGAAHAHGVIHRDLKADNVIVAQRASGGDFVKLVDFGIARSAAGSPTGDWICGTPDYMAPEAMMGGQTDRRVDIYALGVLLFELLTGQRPATDYPGCEPGRPHAAERHPEIPAGLHALILRCLAPRPEHRPATMADVQRELRRFGVSLPPVRPAERRAPTVVEASPLLLVSKKTPQPFARKAA